MVLSSKTNLENTTAGEPNVVYCSAIKMKKKTTLYRLGNNISFAVSSFFNSWKTGKADVVITTSPPALISMFGWMIAKCKGAKLVYDVRDVWPDVAIEMGSFGENSFYSKTFGAVVRFMLLHSDVVTTVSLGKLKKLQEKLPPEQRDKVWLTENGLDENFLAQQEDKSVVELYSLNTKFTCVYIGNIGLAQGLHHLLNLAETVDKEKYQFLLFGDGAERKKLEQEADKRGLSHVKFCGVITSNTVYSVLKNVDMTYIPLVNANLKDSIPTKTYEALGAGCPILMVAEGDAAKIVEKSHFGMALSPNNIEKLPDVFKEFCERYEQIKTNRDFARKYVLENHSRQKIAAEFENRLKALVDL